MYPHCQADSMLKNAPDYDPDINGDNELQPHNNRAASSIQGTPTPVNSSHVEEYDTEPAPANTENTENTDWPDTLHIPIPMAPSTTQEDPEIREIRVPEIYTPESSEIPQLEDNYSDSRSPPRFTTFTP